MSLPYPPVLESQALSRRNGIVDDADNRLRIHFNLPRATVVGDVGNIQVLIRKQINLMPWSRQAAGGSPFTFSPDQEIIYLRGPASANPHVTATQLRDGFIDIPSDALRRLGGTPGFNASDRTNVIDILPTAGPPVESGNVDGVPLPGQTYTIQIRLGLGTIGAGPGPNYLNVFSGSAGAGFAAWRADQVANRRNGEWSNTQRMFVFAAPPGILGAANNIFRPPSPKHNEFLVGFDWQYNPFSDDPLASARLTYNYFTPDGTGRFVKTLNIPFESRIARIETATNVFTETGGWGAFGTIDLPIARATRVQCVLELLTINNTSFTHDLTLERFWPSNNFPLPAEIQGRISIPPLYGEEIDDGANAVLFSIPRNPPPPPSDDDDDDDDEYEAPPETFNTVLYEIFRMNLYTFECLSLGFIPRGTTNPFRLKDFSIEMGEEYAYLAINRTTDGLNREDVLSDVDPLFFVPGADPDAPVRWRPQLYEGRTRNMSFNGISFLNSALHQLRLSGNVQVRNFNRVTSDQITQTIGGQYPFFSRAANFNYRVLSLSALVSIRLDPTHTFLNLVSPPERGGEWWMSDLKLRSESANWIAAPGKFILRQDRDILMAQNGEIAASWFTAFPVGTADTDARVFRVYVPEDFEEYEVRERLLTLTETARQTRMKDYIEQVILRYGDIFTNEDISRNAQREFVNPGNNGEGLFTLPAPKRNTNYPLPAGEQASSVRPGGALTIFNTHTGRDTSYAWESDPSISIYAERRFREAVMQWLANGEPKLFRSETEGNMIVYLTGVGFSPLRDDRLVYSLSATLTEVAEYNLHNLRLYGLIPTDFSGVFEETPEFLANPETVNSRDFAFIPSGNDPNDRPVQVKDLDPYVAMVSSTIIQLSDIRTSETEVQYRVRRTAPLGSWMTQTSPVFSGLISNTDYQVQQRWRWRPNTFGNPTTWRPWSSQITVTTLEEEA